MSRHASMFVLLGVGCAVLLCAAPLPSQRIENLSQGRAVREAYAPVVQRANRSTVEIDVDGNPVDITLPSTVVLNVTESAEAIKGDTASNVQKPATMETGLVVQVPLFIKAGEDLKISTLDGSYLGRA